MADSQLRSNLSQYCSHPTSTSSLVKSELSSDIKTEAAEGSLDKIEPSCVTPEPEDLCSVQAPPTPAVDPANAEFVLFVRATKVCSLSLLSSAMIEECQEPREGQRENLTLS